MQKTCCNSWLLTIDSLIFIWKYYIYILNFVFTIYVSPRWSFCFYICTTKSPHQWVFLSHRPSHMLTYQQTYHLPHTLHDLRHITTHSPALSGVKKIIKKRRCFYSQRNLQIMRIAKNTKYWNYKLTNSFRTIFDSTVNRVNFNQNFVFFLFHSKTNQQFS